MDLKEVFRGLSKKLLSDFQISGQIEHGTDKGSYREDALKSFLADGRLPKKYSIGHGQVITRNGEMSKSLDLVIFDHLYSVPLIYDAATQILPIESVYGVIECKSVLSKEKLLEGLENIKSLKSIAPRDTAYRKGLGIEMAFERPRPYGALFAYKMSDNSLDSLESNLKDWEKDNDPKNWPNLIGVLNEGIFFHSDIYLNQKLTNDEITRETFPIHISYGEEALFHFYTRLLDLCSSTELGSFDLQGYFELPEKIGDLFVKGHDRFTHTEIGQKSRIKRQIIERIYAWCAGQKPIKHGELLQRVLGQLPANIEKKMDMEVLVYLYDPDGLPGLHQVDNPFVIFDKVPTPKERMLLPYINLTINGVGYYIPWAYLNKDDFEIAKA